MQIIACPRCQTQMTVPDNSAGRLVVCTYCSTPVTVPATQPDPLAQMAGAAATATQFRSRPSRGRGLWAAALAAVALIVVAVVMLAILQSKLNAPKNAAPGQTPAAPARTDADAPVQPGPQASPDKATENLAEARQRAQGVLGRRMDSALATSDPNDDIELANFLVDEADRRQAEQPLTAAILFARAGQLIAPMQGKYDAALSNIRAAIGLARSVGGDVERNVYEIGDALRALASSPEARERPPDTSHDPSFFGIR